MIRIDSHQHFWDYDAEQYAWIASNSVLARSFGPNDLQPLLLQHGLNGSIAVQARQSLEENRWLLELADTNPFVKGVVGWVDLRDPHVNRQLHVFAEHPKFVGVRHVAQDEPDDRFLVRDDFMRGIERLSSYDLTYDLLIYPRQLPAAIQLVARFPEQPFVLDHIAKPLIRDQVFEPWRRDIRELAQFPNVHCKLSGMVTEADWDRWKTSDFQGFIETVLECFGPDRLMYGSDWPVALLAASYDQVYDLARNAIDRLDASQQQKVLGANALRFYGLA